MLRGGSFLILLRLRTSKQSEDGMSAEVELEGQRSETNLVREFRFWLVLHLVAWSVLPFLTNHALPLDTLEALVWGKEWAWGYDKHPPLSAWAAEIFGNVLGDWGLYFLSQLCIVIGGWGIWKLGRDFGLSRSVCLLGLILLDAIYFYQYASPEFNVNYIQLPFWAWGWWAGFRGVSTGRWYYWVGLGMAVGLGALGKYLAVVLVFPFLLALWQRGELWEQLRRPGLYLAGLTSLVVFAPHLLWMKEHDWLTITYGLRRAGGEEASWLVKHVVYPLVFLGSQLGGLLPLFVFLLITRRRKAESHVERSVSGLGGLAFGGFFFFGGLSLVFGWEPVTMWAVPIYLALGLWVATKVSVERQRMAARFALGFGLIGLLAYGGVYGLSPYFREKPHRVGYPGKEIAHAVEKIWHDEYGTTLEYVIADEWFGGLVAWYGEDRPSVVIHGEWVRSPSLERDEVLAAGGMVIWLKSRDSESQEVRSLESELPDVNEHFASLEFMEDLVIAWPRRTDSKKGRFGVAVVAPQESK